MKLSNKNIFELKILLKDPLLEDEVDVILKNFNQSNKIYSDYYGLKQALLRQNILLRVPLFAENSYTPSILSSEENHDPYLVTFKAYPQTYFCNFSAIYYHSLTDQVPNNIYVAKEGHRLKDEKRDRKKIILSDHSIFNNFIKPHRSTSRVVEYLDHKIMLTERILRKNSGVKMVTVKNTILPMNSRVTSLERTLIDVIVNPQYNGGITSVVNYFRKASKKASIKSLLSIYKDLDFVYPYWQSIGFLFDRVGSEGLAETIFESFKIKNKFYLDRSAKTSWAFDNKWQISYPKGMFFEHQ